MDSPKKRKITVLLDESTVNALREYSINKTGAVNISAAIRILARKLADNERTRIESD